MTTSAAKKVAGKSTTEPTILPTIDIRRIIVTVIGDTALITHKWSEKAKRQMLEKQMKLANTGKEAKDPQSLFESTIYYDADGDYAFPSMGFR